MIAIAGGPKAGKTTYALSLDESAKSTDSVMDMGWSEASQEVSNWFDDPTINVIEGVAVPRALRKWLNRNPEGKPVSKLVFMMQDKIPLTLGQETMKKGCITVFEEILQDLIDRGVEIEIL